MPECPNVVRIAITDTAGAEIYAIAAPSIAVLVVVVAVAFCFGMLAGNTLMRKG